MTAIQIKPKEEWINILTKGVITIPKKMREQVGLKEGDIARIKVTGNTIVIEPKTELSFQDVRTFSDKELQEWIQQDELPTELTEISEEYWQALP